MFARDPILQRQSCSRVDLARCPLCAYSFVGLPDHHTCPECGFVYEREAVMFSQRRRPWKVLCIAHGALLLGAVIVFVWRGVLSPALALGAVGVVGFGWRLREPKKFILVSRRWLRLLRVSEAEQRYPMEAIERATWNRLDGMVDVLGRSGAVVVRIPSSVLWSHRRSKTLASTITRYASEAASGGS